MFYLPHSEVITAWLVFYTSHRVSLPPHSWVFHTSHRVNSRPHRWVFLPHSELITAWLVFHTSHRVSLPPHGWVFYTSHRGFFHTELTSTQVDNYNYCCELAFAQVGYMCYCVLQVVVELFFLTLSVFSLRTWWRHWPHKTASFAPCLSRPQRSNQGLEKMEVRMETNHRQMTWWVFVIISVFSCLFFCVLLTSKFNKFLDH